MLPSNVKIRRKIKALPEQARFAQIFKYMDKKSAFKLTNLKLQIVLNLRRFYFHSILYEFSLTSQTEFTKSALKKTSFQKSVLLLLATHLQFRNNKNIRKRILLTINTAQRKLNIHHFLSGLTALSHLSSIFCSTCQNPLFYPQSNIQNSTLFPGIN